MRSLQELYRIGMGPSSSHTMGPRLATKRFVARTPSAQSYRVTLQGSLAATGRGHLTDRAILDAIPPKIDVELCWEPDTVPSFHPNGLFFEAFDLQRRRILAWQVYSVGGGALKEVGGDGAESERQEGRKERESIYPFSTAEQLLEYCSKEGEPIWKVVVSAEKAAGVDILDYLADVWGVMQRVIKLGLIEEDVLPGPLRLQRRAGIAYARSRQLLEPRTALVSAYALAVSEENGAGGEVVTAPTCGSAGVIPGVFRYLKEFLNLEDATILRALATAGIFGNLIKSNASISGAEVGCQGEIGAACAMAAAGAAQLLGGSPYQIESAAEMGLEHHLGLTCDPMAGLVQIPCIERNAMAALRSLICAEYALLFDGRHRVSFDQVVQTMNETGHDLPSLYRETSDGGLAKWFQDKSISSS